MLDCHRREEIRSVVTNLWSIFSEGKKYDLMPSICARLSQKRRNMICCYHLVFEYHRRHRREEICCHQFVLDCHRREDVRFVATNLCSTVTEGKKYDLLSPVCARLSSKGRSTICYHQFELDCHRGKKYDLLPPICARLSQKGRSMMCCRQFVLDCHRREEKRFVAADLCSIVTEGKKYDSLPPICARLSQKGRNTI